MVSRVLTEKLFSAGEFRFSLGISSVEPAEFFRNFEGEELLQLRRQALDSSSGDYLQPIGDKLVWANVQKFVGAAELGAGFCDSGSSGSAPGAGWVCLFPVRMEFK